MKRTHLVSLALAATTALVLMAGCTASGSGSGTAAGAASGTTAGETVREIKVTETEMKIEPAVIPGKPGEKVRFVVTNSGKEEHEFESDDLTFHELKLEPGETKSVEVTLPAEPGDYGYFCDVTGHKAAGMQGKVTISK